MSNVTIDEWSLVYRVNRLRTDRKVYHFNKACPQLNISIKHIRTSRLGSMIAGGFTECQKC